MVDPTFTAIAPFSGMTTICGAGRGVIATDRDGLGIATLAVRKSQGAALAQRVRERFGIELPSGNYRREANGITFAGIGPENWLATQENNANDFASTLAKDICPLASISDHSDGYAVLRVSGQRVRDTFAKLIPIDVHPRLFKPGDLASTVASHIGVTVWRLEDAPDGTPMFEIAVFRSLAGSFWHALSQSAAEFGFVVG